MKVAIPLLCLFVLSATALPATAQHEQHQKQKQPIEEARYVVC